MTFEEWWDSNDDPDAPYIGSYGLAKAAFMAGADAVKSLPHRVMFDSGVARGRKDTAAEICKWILEETELHHEDGFTIHDAIVQKFGLGL